MLKGALTGFADGACVGMGQSKECKMVQP
jgi:hypothetical protein